MVPKVGSLLRSFFIRVPYYVLDPKGTLISRTTHEWDSNSHGLYQGTCNPPKPKLVRTWVTGRIACVFVIADIKELIAPLDP